MKGKGKSVVCVMLFVALVGCGGFLSLSDEDEDEETKSPGTGGVTAPDGAAVEGAEGSVVVGSDAGGAGGEGGNQIQEPNPDPGKTFWSCALDAREDFVSVDACNNTLSMRGCWGIPSPKGEECLPEDASAGTQRLYCDPCGLTVTGKYTFFAWWCTCK